MIVLGVVLVVLGYWVFPDLIPEVPARIDSLCGGLGVVLVVIGVVLWIVGAFGRPVGGRRHYW